MAKSIPQIVQSIKRGSGSGKIFTSKQVGPHLDKELQEVADAVKEFMFALIDESGKHKIRRDKSGLWNQTKVTMTTDGGKISVPDYAEQLDQGRKPRAKKIPLPDLIKWVKRYRIQGRSKKSGKFKSVSQDSINSAAYAIQQSIYRNGIKARPFLQATLEFQDVLIASIIEEVMLPEIVSVLELTFSVNKK